MKIKNKSNRVGKLIILAIAGIMSSCASNPSVERYFVDHENKDGFMSFTVPADVIQVKDGVEVDADVEDAINNLNSLIVLRYERSNEQPELFGEYLAELHACLNPDRYEDVFMMSTGGMRMYLKTAHRTDKKKELNELIGFIVQDESFVIARLTGKIEPDKLAKVIRKIDLQSMMENEQLQGLIES